MSADIDVGKITEALNNKVDLPTGDSQDGVDFVVDWQNPTEANGYTWYRKYKSGWVEQGGGITATSSSNNGVAVTLPVEMANADYKVQKTMQKCASQTSGFNWLFFADSQSTYTNTTTTLYLSIPSNSYCNSVAWQISGISA